jgi:2-polyprenyl-3-methyl-5-hydroxy-6-metoxy-1,4-benzoquinol methylase
MDLGVTIINKTMDRADLFTEEAKPIVESLNELIRTLYSKGLHMTDWYGCLPTSGLRRNFGQNSTRVGFDNRGPEYLPLPSAADDNRIPWYLYWEIYWVMKNGPKITSSMRLLDAGRTSSLFSCYLASLGAEVHSIDLNERLVDNGNKIAKAMGWNMISYAMNMKKLSFEDEYFDHAYSICVFEHLDYDTKKSALSEIARCMKPNGVLSITFDYRNPAPYIVGYGADTREVNQLKTKEDIKNSFLSTDHFELLGNQEFYDNQKSYLVHPEINNSPYTFGAVFLKKRKDKVQM